LTLAGAAPPTVRAHWETTAGVSAKGFARDLVALYEGANLVVVPVHSGGGTNIKVLEAMAHARPCLASNFVAAAFGRHFIEAGTILVAKNSDEFFQKTLAALRMQNNIQGFADAGYSEICQNFTQSQFHSRVRDFVHAVMLASSPANRNATKP
jgi:polysaccharide biosynthesis protein PslH